MLAHGEHEAVPLELGVESVERYYAGLDAPARFQVCADCPPDLDGTLARRGYRWESPMSLQVAVAAEVAERLTAPALRVEVADHPDAAWFAVWQAVGAAESPPGPEWRLLGRVRSPSGYVTVLDSDRPISVGRAVADTGWTGVYGMATLPAARRRGAAVRALSAIADWAAAQRTPRIYLQVERDNLAAMRLYEGAGFSELATYHYRVRPCR